MDHLVTGEALAPLRNRYAHWLGLDTEEVINDRDEDAEDIRALQFVLRMERDLPPSWHRALELSASGAALICLDERSEPGGEWHSAVLDYCIGRIRKVTRRARGAHWVAAADLPGIGLADDHTEVRALLPGRMVELDKRISRLQVGGTDVERDEPAAEPEGALRVWLPPEPVMTLGKAMAQTGHAGMIAAALMAGDDQEALNRWAGSGCPVSVRQHDANDWKSLAERLSDPAIAWQQDRLLAVRDAGYTEIAPGTITVIAQAPKA